VWWQILRRLLIFAVSAVVASIVVFALLTLVGDPARTLLGTQATPQGIAQLHHQMGLDRPIPVQYWSWLTGVLRGNFGTSYVTHVAIGPQISDKLQVTLWLVLGGMVVALLVAVPLGTVAALRHDSPSGWVSSGLSQLGVALPAFLAGILLVAVFAVGLHWLPATGYVVPAHDPTGFLQHMILPWLSLGVVQGAVLSRYARSALLDEMGQDYLRTARSKGLTTWRAMVRHGFRNASIPVLTVIGVQLVTILIGAVVVERVFVIPGLGSYLADSVASQDRLAVQGIVLVIVVLSLAVSFVVDVLYTVIDPRLRRSR
jgi:peptide/nickel transport system permease protein